MTTPIKLLYIDLFCGAGGTSTGVESARHAGEQCAKVIACVNHDANAIASHAANHPDAMHFTEDIRTLELPSLVAHVTLMRRLYPDAFVVLWASLECTNFSKAKGGLPRNADSRTLADHLFRYIGALNPDYVQIENVEEFMSWGDLDANGKPISRDAGRCYREWVDRVQDYGYTFEHRILNSADIGAYTSRKRFFGIFAKEGLPIAWPEQTHAKKPTQDDLFGRKLEKWKPVRPCLDLNDEGESIFNRKKPLVEASLGRVLAGCIQFVAGGKKEFLVKYNSMSQKGKYIAPDIDAPSPVVSTQGRIGVAQVNYLCKHFGGTPDGKCSPITAPAGTITCRDHHAFVSAYYGNGFCSSIDRPAPTVTTKDRFQLVQPFIDQQFGNGRPASIAKPLGTLTTTPKYNLVTPWIMNTNFNNVGSSLDTPAQTVTANRKWHYLMNPQFASAGAVTEGRKLPSFIRREGNTLVYEIYTNDTPMMVQIKEFMALYGLVDIKMRMLRIPELKRIMGFPKNYVLIGTQADQKKFIGNAVEVTMARVLCEALMQKIVELNIKPSKVAA